MYIYLDESYNLKDRNKKQFISINGFMTTNVSVIRKRWLQERKLFANKKRRIHANDSHFNLLRQKAVEIVKTHQIYLISVFQDIQSIPCQHNQKYFLKNKLNFEKIYTDLCKHLLFSLNLDEYKKVVITIDNRKHRAGIIGKKEFRGAVEKELKIMYPDVIFEKPRMVPSSSDVLLELADFVSNI
ncbi:MAG: DUF3800 domain-containing protein, partial [Patescibacteria group bacterium]|nr:DUF3800 domain-containing protein [Patescibacteria group bacterium]